MMGFRHVARKRSSNRWNMDLFEDDDLEVIATLIANGDLDRFTVSRDKNNVKRSHHKKNKRKLFSDASARFERFYFNEQCVCSEEDFERRF